MKREFIITEDGSHTLHVPELNEHYHSTHGAVQESRHVYIDAALKPALAIFSEIHLLEIGFGTGLNALLTMMATAGGTPVFYTGIEAYPLNAEESAMINYPEQLNQNRDIFLLLHQSPWNNGFAEIQQGFLLEKLQARLQDVILSNDKYNTVYFDAFAPSIQPELWEKSIFEKIYHAMAFEGILTTYSSKGSVRRTLQEVGFSVERIPAPAGKREMLRARKIR